MTNFTCERCQLTTERENQHDVFLCVTALKAENVRLRYENSDLKTRNHLLRQTINEVESKGALFFGSPGDGEYKTGYADVYTEEERDA